MLTGFDGTDREERRRAWNVILLSILLTIVTLAIFWQTANYQFVFDDEAYITSNAHVAGGMTATNVLWAFTSTYQANWHPVTWLSHMADAQLWGLNPRGHHLTNVVIHAVSSILLFLLFLKATGALWKSAFVAALFALHPLHVESVAWVSERKDVLSAFFGFITLIVYTEYAARRKALPYILTLLLFVLGLMSKPMLVTLPLIMLLMDFWPLDRFSGIAREQGKLSNVSRLLILVNEKIPFFVCSLCSAIVTIYAQRTGAAMVDLAVVPLHLRLENALLAYVKYIGKAIWPHHLAVLYPYSLAIPLWQAVGSSFVLLLLSVAVVRARHLHPYLAMGWFWFLITLMPVIGLIQVGIQSMADRYSYLPSIGLFIVAAWGVPTLVKNLPYRRCMLSLSAATVIVALTALTWKQIGYWRDGISLYRHALSVTAGSSMMHYNLGAALANKGELDEAIQEFQEAIRLDPNNGRAHKNLTRALMQRMEENMAK